MNRLLPQNTRKSKHIILGFSIGGKGCASLVSRYRGDFGDTNVDGEDYLTFSEHFGLDQTGCSRGGDDRITLVDYLLQAREFSTGCLEKCEG